MASCVSLCRGRGEIPFYFCALIEGVVAGVSGYSSANPIPDSPTLVPTYSILNVVMVRLAKALDGASQHQIIINHSHPTPYNLFSQKISREKRQPLAPTRPISQTSDTKKDPRALHRPIHHPHQRKAIYHTPILSEAIET